MKTEGHLHFPKGEGHDHHHCGACCSHHQESKSREMKPKSVKVSENSRLSTGSVEAIDHQCGESVPKSLEKDVSLKEAKLNSVRLGTSKILSDLGIKSMALDTSGSTVFFQDADLGLKASFEPLSFSSVVSIDGLPIAQDVGQFTSKMSVVMPQSKADVFLSNLSQATVLTPSSFMEAFSQFSEVTQSAVPLVLDYLSSSVATSSGDRRSLSQIENKLLDLVLYSFQKGDSKPLSQLMFQLGQRRAEICPLLERLIQKISSSLTVDQQKTVFLDVFREVVPDFFNKGSKQKLNLLVEFSQQFQRVGMSEKLSVMTHLFQMKDVLDSVEMSAFFEIVLKESPQAVGEVLKESAVVFSKLSYELANSLAERVVLIKESDVLMPTMSQLAMKLEQPLFQNMERQLVSLPPKEFQDMTLRLLPILNNLEPSIGKLVVSLLASVTSAQSTALSSGQLKSILLALPSFLTHVDKPVLEGVLLKFEKLSLDQKNQFFSTFLVGTERMGKSVQGLVMQAFSKLTPETFLKEVQSMTNFMKSLPESAFQFVSVILASAKSGEVLSVLNGMSTLSTFLKPEGMVSFLKHLARLDVGQQKSIVLYLSNLVSQMSKEMGGEVLKLFSRITSSNNQDFLLQFSRLSKGINETVMGRFLTQLTQIPNKQVLTHFNQLDQLLKQTSASTVQSIVLILSDLKPNELRSLLPVFLGLSSNLDTKILNQVLTVFKDASSELIVKSMRSLDGLSRFVGQAVLEPFLQQLTRFKPELISSVLREIKVISSQVDSKMLQQLLQVLTQLLKSQDPMHLRRLSALLRAVIENEGIDQKGVTQFLALLGKESVKKSGEHHFFKKDFILNQVALNKLKGNVPNLDLKALESSFLKKDSFSDMQAASIGALDDLYKRRLAGSSARQMRGTLVKRDSVSRLLLSMMGVHISALIDDTSGGLLEWKELMERHKNRT